MTLKITTTPPVPCTPFPETAGDGEKSSHDRQEVEAVPNDGAVAPGSQPAPAKLVVEMGPADDAAAAARDSDVGVFTALEAVGDFARRASLKD
ncbi:hypothetical protein EVAR_25525_1 [Eumeta japonica]|uniref:Uncharacterized protein n=1 Tax=Eumeta variegata TaxID=151549 RepID=A0A4C1VM61_EUMVA|nr:hypothetical protein EVAR_25525_1 [Eumeta japonica]